VLVIFLVSDTLHVAASDVAKIIPYCVARYIGLAIDVGRRRLYYADLAGTGNGGKVGELSTDGTDHRELYSEVYSRPRDVVIDVDNR